MNTTQQQKLTSSLIPFTSDLGNFALGFENLFRNLELIHSQQRGYPPFDVEETNTPLGDEGYTITMAVAGFGENDIKITLKENVLTISGDKNLSEENQTITNKSYFYKGIANRSFSRSFALGNYFEVKNATLKDGLLVVDLKKEVPEHAKPKLIPINGNSVEVPNKVKASKKS